MADVPDRDVIHAMAVYGGSFVSALAQLWQRADDDNRARLKAAFPVYWAEYQALAVLKGKSA